MSRSLGQAATPLKAADIKQRFQRIVDDLVLELGNLAAIAAIAVPGHGRFYFAAGKVDREGSEDATPRHLFQIGSQSKTFVAIALLLLERAGDLSLDDRLIDHLDVSVDPRITLRHLVMNSSGLGEYTWGVLNLRYDPRVMLAPRDLVGIALPQGQLFDPGAHFDYCNTGFVLAAMVIAKVSGKPYQTVLADRIVLPLLLGSTTFGAEKVSAPMLRAYVASQAVPEGVDVSSQLSWAYGAGDGVSSLDDMIAFYSALLDPANPIGLTLDTLTRELGRPMPKPSFALSIGTQYGLGVERRAWAGQTVWGHPGSTIGYCTATWADPASGVIVSTCVTRDVRIDASDGDLRYPRAQLFAGALFTGYALADVRPSP